MPTKNSSPVQPGGGEAPREHGERHGGAGEHDGRRPGSVRRTVARQVDPLEVAFEQEPDPGEATVGDEQVRAAPDDQHGRTQLGDDVGDPRELVVRAGPDRDGERPTEAVGADLGDREPARTAPGSTASRRDATASRSTVCGAAALIPPTLRGGRRAPRRPATRRERS